MSDRYTANPSDFEFTPPDKAGPYQPAIFPSLPGETEVDAAARAADAALANPHATIGQVEALLRAVVVGGGTDLELSKQFQARFQERFGREPNLS